MKEILLMEHFGSSFLADGDLGNKFRFCEIDPLFASSDMFVFDLAGITNISDSFANACFGALAEDHGEELLPKVRFKNCSPGVKSSISAAVGIGLHRARMLARG